ncbi:MAG: glycosyltransferase family 4 protein [Gammaproteobacteria bacterium]|nr:glycosyltransferase family 4 protein [Gammaproteobacteria bacterium]
MKSVCLVTTSPLIVNFFLLPHIASLKGEYRVSLAVNLQEGVALPDDLGAEVIHLPIERKISPWRDLVVLVNLIRLFRQRRFNVVHSMSPKGGLLAMIAGWFARVPVRIHTFTGQVWMTRTGVMRKLLFATDRATAMFSTHLLVDSPSQRKVMLEHGVERNPDKCHVLGSGSVSGVDPERFRPDPVARAAVRRELEVVDDATVFLFLGRLTREKGVLDLAPAFGRVATANRNMVLLMVGPDEENLRPTIQSRADPGRVIFVDYTRMPERYVAAADILCLPSYREGFGSAIIEAAAAGVPVIASRIYGISDATVDRQTGLLHTPGDASDLAVKMGQLIKDPALRARLGQQARERAIAEFSQERLTTALLDYYRTALAASRER